jgi:DNA-binding transcriptional regulator YdaS (Cro superfamily)
MTLREFLSDNKISRMELAEKVGTSTAYLSHIINGRKQPGIKLTSKIIRATEGRVGIRDLRPDIACLGQ